MLLAGDIGGTKTVLALFSEEAIGDPIREVKYPSDKYASFDEIVAEFLSGHADEVAYASFGVAGPVVDGEARLTNLSWRIRADNIEEQFGIPVRLLNDLEAIAHAVPYLKTADLVTLNSGEPEPDGSIGVIAPGTGLGEAYLTWDGERYRAYASEGGHTDFGPANAEQIKLLAYLQPRLGHVSYERVCSGVGIPNLYKYLRHTGYYEEPDWLRQELEDAADKTPVIMNTAVSGKADICVATLELFVEILGAEAGNLALKVMATGGIYIGGGIPPRILPQLQNGRFLERFTQKTPHTDFLRGIPVHMIRNTQAALYGAAHAGLTDLRHE